MGVSLVSDSGGMSPSIHAQATPAQMSIVLIGTSFKTSSIAFRERALRSLQAHVSEAAGRPAHVLESCLLVTCNRLELYIATDAPKKVAESILSGLAKTTERTDEFYVKDDFDAVTHVFRVASGLDSLVVGEDQILQQIREAGSKARTSGTAGSILSSLFVAAFNVGRRVRESLEVTQAGSSVSAFALEFALAKLGSRPSKILLIGTGKTAKLAASQLEGSKVYLVSRRKDALVSFPDATLVTYRQLKRLRWKGDLVISATRHRGYVLKKGDLDDTRKMVLLDLAFPRNIDPAFKTSRFIELYDLDDLAIHARTAPQKEEFATPEAMVRQEAERFTRRLIASRLSPTLATIYKWAEEIRTSETEELMKRLPNLSESDRRVVETMSRSLVSKLIAPHTAFVKGPAGEMSQSEKLRLLESLFGPGAG